VIQNTVAKKLDEGYVCIKRSQLVVVWNAAEERSIVKAVPKDWGTIQLANDDGMTVLVSEGGLSTLRMRFPFTNVAITLHVPQLTLLVVGDLDFFVDALGKHGTCGRWCLYCQLKHPEWQNYNHTKQGKVWIHKDMDEIRECVANDKNLGPDEKKGCMGPALFPSLVVDDFVIPMLHGQMGFTNAVVTWFIGWIESKVQKVGEEEKEARLTVLNATSDLQNKVRARDEKSNELSAVLKQFKIELKLHKKKLNEADADAELKKDKDVEARKAKGDELEQHWLHEILTEQEIGEIESQITGAKEMVRTAKKVKQSCIDAM
jgi:hypothetical protein